MMEYKNIMFSLEDGIATLTLNRPKAWNALCSQLNDEIIDV